MAEIQLTLDQLTKEIKERELSLAKNFIEIGQRLKSIRDNEIYKSQYTEFGDYIDSSGFQFSERHAYRMIQVAEQFSDSDVTKIGVSKCVELLKLPEPERAKLEKEIDLQTTSVRELQEKVKELKGKLKKKEEKEEKVEAEEPDSEAPGQMINNLLDAIRDAVHDMTADLKALKEIKAAEFKAERDEDVDAWNLMLDEIEKQNQNLIKTTQEITRLHDRVTAFK